jgi:hypothetical protein
MNLHDDAECKRCAFFFGVFGPGAIDGSGPVLLGGQCRKNAPAVGVVLVPKQVQSVEAGGTVTVPVIERCTASPHVAPDYWCGEFKARTA